MLWSVCSVKVENRRYLIVGLGNPGQAYTSTRHNIGFMIVDRLIKKYGLINRNHGINAQIAGGKIEGLPVLTAKPLSFMNRSGGPVGGVLQSYKISFEDMVVIHDDIDLDYERLKIKEKGGDGGHNGLRSLIDALGTDVFVRVRMGVGRPTAAIGMVDHVLGDFDSKQKATLEHFLSRAVEAVKAILCDGAKEAMNRFNRKP